MSGFEFTSRYGAELPDPATMCPGECEGMGWVPVKADDPDYAEDWAAAEAEAPTDDGYHFVKCHDCGGTGKASEPSSSGGEEGGGR